MLPCIYITSAYGFSQTGARTAAPLKSTHAGAPRLPGSSFHGSTIPN